MGRFFFTSWGFAEMERELIVERTLAGRLAAAREQGRIGGRRPKLTKNNMSK
ncbi:hypothetical protein ECZU41_54410 [Escherichia coli]|nr:hypothetical protein ECZU41_54410 [Escherichia coli]